jgi:protein MpaA
MSIGILPAGVREHSILSEPQLGAWQRRSIKKALMPLLVQVGTSAHNLRADSAGFWRVGEDRYWLPRVIFRGENETGEPYIRVAIFAGIHGDEPAGVHAIVDFLSYVEANPFLFRAYRLHIYPLCNPTGFEDGTRKSRSGKDLNREFWHGSSEPEVTLIERELLLHKFDGIIALHSDRDSDGLYGFVRGHTLAQHLLKPALAAAQAALPVNRAASIDGFHAVEGIIHTGYGGILSAPPGQTPAPFEIVLESPLNAAVELQREAFVLALTETLREYRRLVSFAQNI